MYTNITPEKVISGPNLSECWAEAFRQAYKSREGRIGALCVAITDLEDGHDPEDLAIRDTLDSCLRSQGAYSTSTVASTIFPSSLWNRNQGRSTLFDRYRKVLDAIHQCQQNRNGLYFERLTNYGRGPCNGNQLEHIIQTYNAGNHRVSALQASIMDPGRDHTNQRLRGFPCLQHVVFAPCDRRWLTITGFYARQYLFAKGYGNYLGLYRLGQFMAQEMDLTLTSIICVACDASLGDTSKNSVASLYAKIDALNRLRYSK